MEVLIVGAGTMGRWFAETVDGWLSVTFTDTDPTTAAAAASAHGSAHVAPDDASDVEVVCTAVPLSVTTAVIGRYAPLAGRAVIDLSGSMGDPIAAMNAHAPDRERVSLHPLFAPENAPGNVAIVAEDAGGVTDTLRDRLEADGHRTFETTAEAHDRAMETIQAKTHAALLAYALAADPVDERFQTPVSSQLSTLAGTMLDGTPRVYAEIQSHFPGADDVARESARIAAADEDAFVELYEAGARRIGTADQGSE